MAALTKQTGLAEGVAVIAVLVPGPRRGLACVAALAEVAVLGLSTLVLSLTSGGWYFFYVFKLMGEHSFGGTVAVPADPGLSLLAGMAPAAHQGAASDVLRASDQAAIANFTASAADAVAARRFSAIITDGLGAPLAYPPSLRRYYRQCPQPLLAGVPAALFQPVAGVSGRPASLWLPRGSGSCQAAVSVLDGAGKESHR